MTRIGTSAAVCRLQEGLYCDTTESEPTCKPVVAEGEYCGDYYACGVEAECYYEDTLPGQPTICLGTTRPLDCTDTGCQNGLGCIDGTCGQPTTFSQMTSCSALLAL
jgi:hypothetical protein